MDDASNSIKRIGASCVRKICSGQVVVDVATAVKELVENALDAKATQIDINLKECGVDEISVSDNGTGIPEADFESVALRHATSKLADFDDLESGAVRSFGFRGEALASTCELSREVEVATRHASATCGTRLRYGRDGAILEQVPAPRSVGTTVVVRELFSHLPVRRADLARNSKKHYAKALRTLHAYALGARSARLRVTNLTRGKTQPPVLQVRAGRSLRETVATVFGSQFASTLVELEEDQRASFVVRGLVSRAAGDGVGRAEGDRQFVFVNDRPVDLPKLTRAANEVWRQFEMKQKPALILEIQIRPSEVDVNVAPDKREVVIENEEELVNFLKETLRGLWAPTSRDARTFLSQAPVKEQSLSKFSTPPASPSQDGRPDEDDVASDRRQSGSMRMFARNFDDDEKEKIDDTRGHPIELDLLSPDKGVRLSPQPDDGGSSEQQQQQSSETVIPLVRNETKSRRESPAHQNDDEQLDILQADDEPSVAKSVTHRTTFCEPTTTTSKANGDEQEELSHQVQETTRQGAAEAKHDEIERPERILMTRSKIDSCRAEETSSPIDDLEARVAPPEDNAAESVAVRMSPVAVVDESSRKTKRQMKLNDYGRPIKTPRVTGELSEDDDDDGNHVAEKTAPSDEVMTLGKFGAVGPSKRVNLLDEETIYPSLPREASSANILAGASLASDDEEARKILSKVVTKGDFKRMSVVGQFNKGFILARLDDSLFIIDQHAADEKFRYEANWRSQVTSQPLVAPLTCFETAADELIVLERRDAFEANGFRLEIDPDAVVGQRAKIVALPVVKGVTFGASDARELLALLSDAPDDTIPRLPKLHTVFASKACRSAVMIGTALDTPKMTKLVAQLADLNQPWNCPHGRPTMRHLTTLARLDLRARKAHRELHRSDEVRVGPTEDNEDQCPRDSDDEDDDSGNDCALDEDYEDESIR